MNKHNSQKVRFAVLGCGYIGKRHAQMILGNENTELTVMADLRERENISGMNHYNDVPFCRSLDDMLERYGNEIDVVTIATPNGLHAQHSLKCLAAAKHIVVEKPLALRKSDAERVLYKALYMNKHVFSIMQNRYSPPSVWLKELITKGVLGNIYMVQINCFWNRDERYYVPGSWHGTKSLDGGTLFTQFSHFIDIMYWLFGDITNIRSKFSNNNHSHLTQFEDSGFVNFEFETGGMGCIHFTTSVWDKNLESSLTIIAENGSVKVGGQYMNEVEHCNIKNYKMPDLAQTNPPNDYGAYKGSAANHHHVFENVVNVLRGNEAITTNALEGLKVVEMIERIYHSGNVTENEKINSIANRRAGAFAGYTAINGL
jgi:UDP-N-acetyl-2-amino-2-deoxyglucuronate dehydrogenase